MMAQDAEVAPAFQPLLGLTANFLGSDESQVADPMIEATQTMLENLLTSLQAFLLRPKTCLI
jgi:hypothetical protein